MNKLVIVGNGFDLAHGLPTSYRHFINSFWENLKQNFENEFTQNLVYTNPNYFKAVSGEYKNFKEFLENLKAYAEEYGYRYEENTFECYTDNSRFHPIFQFKNDLFKKINIKSIKNWVDIENEYYLELKRISKDERGETAKNLSVKLNAEFDSIKSLLNEYLKFKVENSFDLLNGRILHFDYLTKIFEIRPRYLTETRDRENFLKEFSKEDHYELIDLDDKISEADKNGTLHKILGSGQVIYQTVFLNFNYTNSLLKYIEILNSTSYGYHLKASEIAIHGKLDDMNFGFGDEMDNDYKLIEDLNENEFLKNLKSFKYLQNSNYKDLLDYIDSDKFQVYIMGHSCGLSDRTLLNTIFEHDNCRSIKVFYHQREDGTDNFTEIIQNISRHFNDKKMMRAKVVNKSLCSPLPQNIRFQRKDS